MGPLSHKYCFDVQKSRLVKPRKTVSAKLPRSFSRSPNPDTPLPPPNRLSILSKSRVPPIHNLPPPKPPNYPNNWPNQTFPIATQSRVCTEIRNMMHTVVTVIMVKPQHCRDKLFDADQVRNPHLNPRHILYTYTHSFNLQDTPDTYYLFNMCWCS